MLFKCKPQTIEIYVCEKEISITWDAIKIMGAVIVLGFISIIVALLYFISLGIDKLFPDDGIIIKRRKKREK
jgi:hypothetical protein